MSKKEDLIKAKKVRDLGNRSELTEEEKRKRELETKSTSELMKKAENNWKKSEGRGFTADERKDAYNEITVGKKYKDVSPLMHPYGPNNFNIRTPKDNTKINALTQDEADRRNIGEEFIKRSEELRKKK